MYWLFGFANPDVNTVTTGGITYQVMMEQEVVFYQPTRDVNADEEFVTHLSPEEELEYERLSQKRKL